MQNLYPRLVICVVPDNNDGCKKGENMWYIHPLQGNICQGNISVKDENENEE